MLHKLIFRIFDYLIFSSTTFFFGVGEGPSQTEYGLETSLAQAGNFGVSQGEGDILASDNFWKAILSGDPAQISKVLGPQESAINKQGQQANMTAAQFGNRSGGTNAGAQQRGDTTRTSIDQMISQLTGSAAGALGSQGSSLFGQGTSGLGSAFSASSTIQGQNANKWNDIFKSVGSIAAPVIGGFSQRQNSSGGGGNWWDNVPDYSTPANDSNDIGTI